MERPNAPPGLQRARQQLTELRAMVNAFCEAEPPQLRIAQSDFRMTALDAQVMAVNAPAASLEADIFALEARVGELRKG